VAIRHDASAAAAAIAVAVIVACGGGAKPSSTTGPGPASVPPTTATKRPQVVVFGDSLTAGLGLEPSQAYPALLQQRIDSAGYDYDVINAGVSGDTSAGGLSRTDWVLGPDVRVLVVAFGGNDGLRGLPVEELKRNLGEIIRRAKTKQVAVVLAGMEAPPNLGKAYTDAFRDVYTSLAREENVPLVPFLLAGVAGVASLNQADGIHPTAEGARMAAENVWPVLQPLLERQTRHSR
jgi:acyl-CoA thioesterase-1